MDPSTIPDDEIWEGAERMVISPPGGDLLHPTIRAVEALFEIHDGQPVYAFRMVLDDTDVERINAGERVFWMTQTTRQVVPWWIGWPEHTPYDNAPDPYPEELSADEADAIRCPGWLYNHSSLEVPLTEEELTASRATDGADARRGYWKRGPWCMCGKTYAQHTDAELFPK